jgi:hypothetical protein
VAVEEKASVFFGKGEAAIPTAGTISGETVAAWDEIVTGRDVFSVGHVITYDMEAGRFAVVSI